MSASRRTPTDNRAPVFLFPVPANRDINTFPAAKLNVHARRPSTSQLIIGAALGPVFGLPLAALVATMASPQHAGAVSLGGAAGLVVLVLLLVLLTINLTYGDWTMLGGAAVVAPVVLFTWGEVRPSIGVAAVMALATVGAVRAHITRGVRYRRLSPIFLSARPLAGTVVDVRSGGTIVGVHKQTFWDEYKKLWSVTVTVAELPGWRVSAEHTCRAHEAFAILGAPVAVWICDLAPDIAVMCFSPEARVNARRADARRALGMEP